MKNNKVRKHKAAYIFAPILGLGLIAGTVTPIALAKPNKWVDEDTKPTVELDSGSSKDVSIKSSSLKIGTTSTINLDIKQSGEEKKQIGNIEIKIDGKTLSEEDYVINQEDNTIVIKASAMTGTKINVSITTEKAIEFEFGFKGKEEGELISHSIRRTSTSTIIFSVPEGYKLTSLTGEYEDAGEGGKITKKDYTYTEGSNIYTVIFKDKTIFKDATGLSMEADIEPETEEKTATIGDDFSTFASAGITISDQHTTQISSSSTEASTITLPYSVENDVSGKILIEKANGWSKQINDVKFVKDGNPISILIDETDWEGLNNGDNLKLTFIKDVPVVKTAAIVDDFKTFAEAGININTESKSYTPTISESDSAIILPYTADKQVTGKITIMADDSIEVKVIEGAIFSKTESGEITHVIKITKDEWSKVTTQSSNWKLTFEPDTPAVKTASVTYDTDGSLKDGLITMSGDQSVAEENQLSLTAKVHDDASPNSIVTDIYI